MSLKPLISVIIPVYNTAIFLPRCLHSVLQNTYPNLEVICVNDGSTDASPQILQSFMEADARVSVITQENRGVSMARNAGMEAATGDYITFIDSDDYIHPEYFDILLQAALRYDADMVACQIMRVTADDSVQAFERFENIDLSISENSTVYEGDRAVDGKGLVVGTGMSKMYRLDLVKNIRFQNKIAIEDIPFCLEAVCAKPDIRCVYIRLRLYYYMRHSGSFSTKMTFNDEYAMAVYFYNSGIDAEKAGQKQLSYAYYLHAMKRGILLRYRCMFKKETNRILHSFTKDCLKEYLGLKYPGHHYQKIRYIILANSPLIYHIGHLMKRPEDRSWELDSFKKWMKERGGK